MYYKKLPFNIQWIEFPDIEGKWKELGAPASDKLPDGQDYYTAPMVVDSETGEMVVDSWKVAEWLDKKFPETPALFPQGSHAAVRLFEVTWRTEVVRHLIPLLVPRVYTTLNPASQPYFRLTRESFLGKKLEEVFPEGPEREAQWELAKAGLDKIDELFKKNGAGEFFLGETFSYADCIAGAWLRWAHAVSPKEYEEKITKWNNGRWGKLVQTCEKKE